jgi:hypothetical protein
MKSPLACAAMLALIVSPIGAQRTVHGVVFNDANANGIMDPTERPLPGVVVSNQVEVVTTDAAGRYQLPADAKTIVFVSVPTDWRSGGAAWRAVGASDSISFGLRAERQPRSCPVHSCVGHAHRHGQRAPRAAIHHARRLTRDFADPPVG